MIEIRTGARIHIGLLHLPPAEPWPAHWPGTTIPARYFGGIGWMIDQPNFKLKISPSTEWMFDGPQSQRCRDLCDVLTSQIPDLSPCHIHVEDEIPPHAGLGSGTQLALALGRGVLLISDRQPPFEELAQLVLRGRRSGIGTYGFASGGFIIDAGKPDPLSISRPALMSPLPSEWRFVIVNAPQTAAQQFGSVEEEKFRLLQGAYSSPDDMLYRIALTWLPVALGEKDVKQFGAAVTEFNARVGDQFKSVQGGRYASEAIAFAVDIFLRTGAAGAGQSSWGPAAFAICGDADEAKYQARGMRKIFPDAQVIIAKPFNRGASVKAWRSHPANEA